MLNPQMMNQLAKIQQEELLRQVVLDRQLKSMKSSHRPKHTSRFVSWLQSLACGASHIIESPCVEFGCA